MRTLGIISVLAALIPFTQGCGGGDRDAPAAEITIVTPAGHRLGGTATGIPPRSTLTLTEARAGQIAVAQDGPFWFEKVLSAGTAYSVSIDGLQGGKYCTLENASGSMPPSNHPAIVVACKTLGEP